MMNELRFLAAMGGIGDDLLEEADVDLERPCAARPGSFKRNALVVGAVAAAAAITVGLVALYQTKAPSTLPDDSAASWTQDCGTLPGGQINPAPADTEPTTDLRGVAGTTGNAETTVPPNDASAPQTTARGTEDGTDPAGSGRRTETTAPDDSPTRRGTEPTSSKPPAVVSDPTRAPAEPTTQPPSDQSDPGTPGAVYTRVSVGYSEARETFGYPIAPCYDGSFIGYEVGVVSRNGDIHADGARCLTVIYEFADGSVSLTDQDAIAGGNVVSYSGEQYEYGGRTFCVWEHGYADGVVYVGYYPTGESGIAYQAVFDEGADVYEIMDLIIELEI